MSKNGLFWKGWLNVTDLIFSEKFLNIFIPRHILVFNNKLAPPMPNLWEEKKYQRKNPNCTVSAYVLMKDTSPNQYGFVSVVGSGFFCGLFPHSQQPGRCLSTPVGKPVGAVLCVCVCEPRLWKPRMPNDKILVPGTDLQRLHLHCFQSWFLFP